jgi:uncharacterized protein YjbI with pentapeptide repeats
MTIRGDKGKASVLTSTALKLVAAEAESIRQVIQNLPVTARRLTGAALMFLLLGTGLLLVAASARFIALGSCVVAAGVACMLAATSLTSADRQRRLQDSRERALRSTKLAERLHSTTNHEGHHFGESELLHRVALSGHSFRNATLDHAEWSGADLTGCDFTSASLAGATFVYCNARRACFRDATLDRATLIGAFVRADFVGASCRLARMSHAMLDGAIFSSEDGLAYLRETDFSGSSALDSVVFSRTYGEEASFCGATLFGTVFHDAFLASADFSNAELSGCNFQGAMFSGLQGDRAASFGGTEVGVDYLPDDQQTNLSETWLLHVDLSTTLGLEHAKLVGALASRHTRFPDGFDAAAHGVLLLHDMPRDAAYAAVRSWRDRHGRPAGWTS